MKFALKNGIFTREMRAPDGEIRRFNCPASAISRRCSRGTSIDGSAQAGPMAEEGTGLFHICQKAEALIAAGRWAEKKAVKKVVAAANWPNKGRA